MKDNRNDRILQHLPLVSKVVDIFFFNYTGELEKGELVSIGVIGLIDALDKYDETKNASFETYAKMRIKGAIIDEMRRLGKISRTNMEKVNSLYRATEKLQQSLLRDPTDNELQEHLGVEQSELNSIYGAVHFLGSQSLEATIFQDSESDLSLIDMIADRDSMSAHELLERDEMTVMLAKCLDMLSERERLMMNLIYYEELALRDIADILGVSVSRVSQMHGKSILKLKTYLRKALELN